MADDSLPNELQLVVEKHVKYIQSLDKVNVLSSSGDMQCSLLTAQR